MPSVTIVWNREKRAVAQSSGVPLVFPTSGDADTHIARLKAQEVKSAARHGSVSTYDKVTVTI